MQGYSGASHLAITVACVFSCARAKVVVHPCKTNLDMSKLLSPSRPTPARPPARPPSPFPIPLASPRTREPYMRVFEVYWIRGVFYIGMGVLTLVEFQALSKYI